MCCVRRSRKEQGNRRGGSRRGGREGRERRKRKEQGDRRGGREGREKEGRALQLFIAISTSLGSIGLSVMSEGNC